MCRADYLAFARGSKTLAEQSFKIKATHTIVSVNHRTTSKSVPIRDSVVPRKETSVRRRLLKRRDLHDCRRVPSKPLPFLYTPKRIKKRMGFRRRCGTSVNVKVGSIREADIKSKIVRNPPNTKKKVRRPLSRKLPKPTSTPELKHLTVPKYDISYKRTLAAYKSMRKGSSFYPSRRVLWKNRHRLVLGGRFNKNSFYDDYQFSPKQEKEYFCPEPPEEDEDIEENNSPQWLQTGPEYSSDYAGDGPDSSEEYDPEKDKAMKRKRINAKANRRLRRKRKQRDSEHRSNE